MTSSSFSHNLNVVSNTGTLELIGPLNESAKLPEMPSVAQLRIKLDRLVQINSIGIREWCNWISRMPKVRIILQGCPFLFIKSVALVKGVLPPNATIVSMYLPFYSEKSGEETYVLLEHGRHFNDKGLLELPSLTDSKGNPLGLEITAQRYLTGFFKA